MCRTLLSVQRIKMLSYLHRHHPAPILKCFVHFAINKGYLLDGECSYDVFGQWLSFYQRHFDVSVYLCLIRPVTHTLHLGKTIYIHSVYLNMHYMTFIITQWPLTEWDDMEVKMIAMNNIINENYQGLYCLSCIINDYLAEINYLTFEAL